MSTPRSLLAATGALLAFATGCGGESSPGRQPEQALQPSAGTGDGRAGDCVARVDALIDSRTIPRADRDYAIGMCIDHR